MVVGVRGGGVQQQKMKKKKQKKKKKKKKKRKKRKKGRFELHMWSKKISRAGRLLASEKEERELIDRSADQERMELRGLELWINSIETD